MTDPRDRTSKALATRDALAEEGGTVAEQTTELAQTRVTTIRLPADLAEQLNAVARVDGVPVSEVVRTAIAAHIASRKADREFRARLAARIARDQALLEAMK